MPRREKCCVTRRCSQGHYSETTQGLFWCISLWLTSTGGENENECLIILKIQLKCKRHRLIALEKNEVGIYELMWKEKLSGKSKI